MRILSAILSFTAGGAEQQLAGIATELARRGHESHVVFIQGGVHTGRLTEGRCILHRLTAHTKYDPLLLARSVSLVRRVRPDVVHTWLAHMDIIAGRTARLLGCPWVMSERSAALSYPPTLLNRVRVAGARRADLIVANSPGGAEYWAAHGVDRSRIEVIPNFISLEAIASTDPLQDDRIADDDELVLYAGRLSPEKNLRQLLNALPTVLRARPRAKLALCGDGRLLEELRAQARAANVDGRVVFAGFVHNVAPWLNRAHAAVSVSPCEGHPNAILEAIAVGVPVVVSDIPAHRSILADDSASFVRHEDAYAIAEAIIQTLEGRAAALQRAKRARQTLASPSLEEVVTRYEASYRRVMAAPGTR